MEWTPTSTEIANGVDHCLAVKAAGGSVWGDVECCVWIKFMTPVGVFSLIPMVVAMRLEVKVEQAEADVQICKAAGVLPDLKLQQQPPVALAGHGPECLRQ
ncbi:hypothetical protein E2562_013350 [Oryza meyeriana var. granulata]|uniref:Uncharacterized protein n=1 Tax=Oryza meyeriana var. granulata TaxID=110450 RepID=A0A6G1CER4_9ORYZ|nr:hypothetical protein E2562_013350 [Oryza meyeriana var. granulata]